MPQPSEPRRHHYVPKFLLGGFTPSGAVDDYLWVHDTREHSAPRRQRPDQVAHQRDFNRIDIEDVDPFVVEKEFADIESRTAPIVRAIEATWELPSSEEFKTLLWFVATQAARVPGPRESISNFIDELARMTLDAYSATPDRWERKLSAMRAGGHDVEDVEWEAVRDLLKPGALRFNLDRTWHVAQVLTGAETIMRFLVPRRWCLAVAGKNTPGFVCCDNPVSLVSTVPLPPLAGPGFGMRNTMVVARLTRRLALVGRFEPGEGTLQLDRPQSVALFNTWAVAHATRWVYSPEKDFIWLKPDGRYGHASDLVEVIRERGS